MQCKLFEYLQQTVANNRKRATSMSKELILLCFSLKEVSDVPVVIGSVNMASRSVLWYVQESEDSRAYE